jgi:glycosyltransferase involved in cell wall biosynthesis
VHLRVAEARLVELEMRQQVFAVMEYIRAVDVDGTVLVSVVMATRNRADRYLPRAIRSVLAQTHRRWELVVVDDGSDDDTGAVVGAFADHRIRYVRTEHRGLSAARNEALDVAEGDIVAYLDDDNLLHFDWLRSAVWAFSELPDVDVIYGSMIIDDRTRAQQLGSGGLPVLNFTNFDRRALQRGNITDIGAVAHRARMPEARFDESVPLLEDWEFFARITRDKDPLPFPVVAGVYTTSAPERMMDRSSAELTEAIERLRARLEASER